MTPRPALKGGWTRALALTGTVLLGVGTIVGSGGGDAPQCSFFSNVCEPVVGVMPTPPSVVLDPQRRSVQAGTPVVFMLQIVGISEPTVRWQRSADGGQAFTDIAGATGPAYTLANPQPPDDGAVFVARVSAGAGGTAVVSNTATVAVSPAPGVVLADGDFAPAAWAAAASASPATGGPTHSEERRADGGNPAAMRRMVHMMTAGPSSLTVYNVAPSAAYDPATQGAITAIDYSEDCSRIAITTATAVHSTLLIEQGGRRYLANRFRSCNSNAWSGSREMSTLRARDFDLVDGAACAAGQACPDFSSSGAPLTFGFARRAAIGVGVAAISIEHAIDNWTVTVWRK